jgi:hydroxypyruvate isomerase
MPVRLAANISLLFNDVPYLDRPAAAAAAGFTAVETWWPFGADPEPSTSAVDDFLEAIAATPADLVAVNFFAGDMPAGERGVVSLPHRTAEFRVSTETIARIARDTGCTLFNALYGVRDARFDPDEQDATAISNLRYAAHVVGPAGGTVLIEALAHGENGAYPLISPSDVAQVIDQCATPNVAMLADFYHFAQNGHDFTSVLNGFSPLIRHIQIADAPGRHEPGTGSIDFAGLFRAVDAVGYAGWIGAEYRPMDSTETGLSWAAELGLELSGKRESD